VPFHQRLDDGVVKFVNNDHCLLSARATLRLTHLMPRALKRLPMAQTVWYVPTALDPWNQLLGRAPGHYARMYEIPVGEVPPPPTVHWQDQAPLARDASFPERLNEWLALVQSCDVNTAYRVFLGLLDDTRHDADRRRQLLSQLVFGGLIDVQDRMLFNRSYTTGHKAYRARATVELSETIGWESAHAVVYAGVPDLAVGPHWYSSYEMAANVCQASLDGRDHELRRSTGALSPAEQIALEDVLLHGYEPSWQEMVTELLRAGKGPRPILQVMAVAAAELIIEAGAAENYSMPQHSAEYCNSLRWYLETFDHPHQVKLLYVAGSMVNQAAHHQAGADPTNGPTHIRRPRGSDAWSGSRLLDRLDQALLQRNVDDSLALTVAYLDDGHDPRPLVELLAIDSTKFGNDPHNQEIGLSLIEDYLDSQAVGRNRLLLACVKNITGYRKYGDPLEAYHRYAEAFDIRTPTTTAPSDAPVEALVLDD
jgi:hypothetical protein